MFNRVAMGSLLNEWNSAMTHKTSSNKSPLDKLNELSNIDVLETGVKIQAQICGVASTHFNHAADDKRVQNFLKDMHSTLSEDIFKFVNYCVWFTEDIQAVSNFDIPRKDDTDEEAERKVLAIYTWIEDTALGNQVFKLMQMIEIDPAQYPDLNANQIEEIKPLSLLYEVPFCARILTANSYVLAGIIQSTGVLNIHPKYAPYPAYINPNAVIAEQLSAENKALKLFIQAKEYLSEARHTRFMDADYRFARLDGIGDQTRLEAALKSERGRNNALSNTPQKKIEKQDKIITDGVSEWKSKHGGELTRGWQAHINRILHTKDLGWTDAKRVGERYEKLLETNK